VLRVLGRTGELRDERCGVLEVAPGLAEGVPEVLRVALAVAQVGDQLVTARLDGTHRRPCWVAVEQDLRGVPLQVLGLLLGAPQRLLHARVAVERNVEQVAALVEDPPDRLEPMLGRRDSKRALRPALVTPATRTSSNVAVVGALRLRGGTEFGLTLLVVGGGQSGAEQVAELGGTRGGLTEGGLHVGDVRGIAAVVWVVGCVGSHGGWSFHGVMPGPEWGRWSG